VTGSTDQRRSGEPIAGHQGPDRHVLDMLVCPLTKTRLILSEDKSELISLAARLAFPIRDGIPEMVLEEARPISEEEVDRLER
jgi:hypothetical protein